MKLFPNPNQRRYAVARSCLPSRLHLAEWACALLIADRFDAPYWVLALILFASWFSVVAVGIDRSRTVELSLFDPLIEQSPEAIETILKQEETNKPLKHQRPSRYGKL